MLFSKDDLSQLKRFQRIAKMVILGRNVIVRVRRFVLIERFFRVHEYEYLILFCAGSKKQYIGFRQPNIKIQSTE